MQFIARKIGGELYVSLDQVNKAIEEKDSEIENIKAENERFKSIRKVHIEAIASMAAGLHQEYNEIFRLNRALWLARAEWARSSALSYHLIENHPNKDVAATYKRKANKWEKAKAKCLKKAELYR